MDSPDKRFSRATRSKPYDEFQDLPLWPDPGTLAAFLRGSTITDMLGTYGVIAMMQAWPGWLRFLVSYRLLESEQVTPMLTGLRECVDILVRTYAASEEDPNLKRDLMAIAACYDTEPALSAKD